MVVAAAEKTPPPAVPTDVVPQTQSVNTTAAAVAPPPKTLQVVWNYPAGLQTPDLVFKLYHSTNINIPLRNWPLLTNVPGTARSVRVPATQARDFFTLTASNFLGESSFATR